MTIEALSSTAASFPDVEVDYEDLLELRHRMDGRGADGTVDCLGLLLLIYRRAGLGLPDPKASGGSLDDFQDMFDPISTPDTIFDVVYVRREQGHIMTVVRPGLLISAKARTGVYTQRVNHIKTISDVTFWRIRDELLP